MDNLRDPMQLTEPLPDLEKKISELKDDIDIRMQASLTAKGTSDGDETFITGSNFATSKLYRSSVSFKQWEGTILSIEDNNTFLAKVRDIAGADLPKIIRFDRRKVDFENGSMFAEGASFYWKVGVFYNPKGTAIKRSEIRFRLLPPPNPKLLEVAEEEINRIFDMLTWAD